MGASALNTQPSHPLPLHAVWFPDVSLCNHNGPEGRIMAPKNRDFRLWLLWLLWLFFRWRGDSGPHLCWTQFSADNVLARPCLMSICHLLHGRMCSPKASRNTSVLVLPPRAVYSRATGRPAGFSGLDAQKDPSIHVNPAAWDAHPTDVVCVCFFFYVSPG